MEVNCFLRKSQKKYRIVLMKGSKVLTEEENVQILSIQIFNGVVKEREILINEDHLLENVMNIDDLILLATEKCKRHPSILKIKEKNKIQNQFRLKHVTSKQVKRIIKDIEHQKPTQKGDIPVKVTKENILIFIFSRLSQMFNLYIDKGLFPNELKQAIITPIYKKR